MSDWASTKLRELVGSPISGSRPAGGVNTETEGVPSLGGENILAEGGITFDNLNRVSSSFYKAMPKGRLQPFDVLINKDGAQTGKVGLYKGDFSEACVNEHVFILRNQNKSNDQRFLFYSVLLPETQKKIARRITGSAQPGLNTTFVDVVDILIPSSSAEQSHIAEILSVMDSAIEKTEALIAKYQQIKAGLMHDLFTRGVTADGKLRLPREQAPELYQDTLIGWIPKKWEVKPLGKIASFQRGHDIVETQFREGPFPVVSSSGVIGFHSMATTKSPNVIVGRKGNIGKVHFLEHDFWAHDTSLFVTNFFGNDVRFIYYLCLYLDLARFGTRSGSPSLNRNDIHPILVGLPKTDEQVRIWSLIDRAVRFLESEKIQLSKLRSQKLGLMSDLLTGKVRVKGN